MSKSIKLPNDIYLDVSSISCNKQSLLDALYPIGCTYFSTVNTNPSNYFGGTWTQIPNDYLLSFITSGTFGTTGTSNSVTEIHTLTVDEMPSHSHGYMNNVSWLLGYRDDVGGNVQPTFNWTDNGEFQNTYLYNAGGSQGHTHNLSLKKFQLFGWYRTK